MAEPKADALAKAVQSLVAEKQAIALKERELIVNLNAALNRMGYQVVRVDAGPPRSGRGRRGRPARRSQSGRRRERDQGHGRSPKAAGRRRGRRQ